MKSLYYTLFTYILSWTFASSQTITVTGSNWTPTITPITEAGNDYVETYESATNHSSITINLPLLLGFYKVSINYQPSPTWHNDLKLSAKRTNDGSTTCILCSIGGGTTYQDITTTSIELFRINSVVALSSYSNIQIQYKLSGVSVKVPAANYGSRIVFTVSSP